MAQSLHLRGRGRVSTDQEQVQTAKATHQETR